MKSREAPSRRDDLVAWMLGRALGARDALLDLVYPPVCAACAAPIEPDRDPVSAVLCLDCAACLEPLGEACARCAAPTTPWDITSRGEGCLECRRLNAAFAKVHVGWWYGGPLLEAVHAFKYDREVHLARSLSNLLVAGMSTAPRCDLVVAVPSHPRRVQHRGFDHAACLGLGVGRRLGVGFLAGVLERSRDTPPQARLGLEARLGNVKGAIAVASRARARVEGRRILLIDDVMTSGATVAACAEVLSRAGASRVEVGVLARAP